MQHNRNPTLRGKYKFAGETLRGRAKHEIRAQKLNLCIDPLEFNVSQFSEAEYPGEILPDLLACSLHPMNARPITRQWGDKHLRALCHRHHNPLVPELRPPGHHRVPPV